MTVERITKGMVSAKCQLLTPDEIADAVWDEDLSGHTIAGTAGKIVSSIKKIVDAILGLIS